MKVPSVKDQLFSEPWKFGFFQAVRVLERASPGREPVARAVRPSAEVVRFRSNVTLAFPASEIVELKPPPPEKEDRPPELKVNFVGLTGPLGVLPTCYTELVIERNAYKDRALHEFLDLFHHRIVSLFYRAWEKYRFPVSYERTGEDSFTEYLFDVVGMGTPGLRGRMSVVDQALLLYGGLIAQRPHSAEAVASIVRHYFHASARVEQFLGQRFPLEDENLTRIGQANSELGRNMVAGSTVFVSQSKFRVVLGPLPFVQYTSFLPVGPAWKPLTELTRYLVGLEFDYDVQLVLKKEEVPPCHLSSSSALPPMLGWTAWMTSKPPEKDASELVLPVND